MDHAYPTTKAFWQLPRDAQKTRLDVADNLLDALQFCQRDSRLSGWQRGFLASVLNKLMVSKGTCRISPKEWAKIHEIQDITECPPGWVPQDAGDQVPACDLFQTIRDWRGDPRLNSWQEGFLASISQRLHGGMTRLSPKEIAKIREIQDVIEREVKEDADGEVD